MVHDSDEAIGFFVDVLGFELVEDSPAQTSDGRPKRWVVVRPPGATTALLLARVDEFQSTYDRLRDVGVEFVTAPRNEPYGRVAVFLDIAGNRWDLLGP